MKIQLKAVDTIGNCQRLAFTVGVSQHMHKITHLWKFELNRSSNLRDNNEEKNTLVTPYLLYGFLLFYHFPYSYSYCFIISHTHILSLIQKRFICWSSMSLIQQKHTLIQNASNVLWLIFAFFYSKFSIHSFLFKVCFS